LTDRDLLSRYLKGDVSAFESLLDRYEKPLLRFAARYRQGGSADRARDIVQEVFLKLLSKAGGLRNQENLSPWLYRVARNLAIDEKRRETRMEKYHREVAMPEIGACPVAPVESREIAEIINRKLHGLPPNQRDVLILKIQEGKSYREIADITGLTTSNIGYLIHHGLKKLSGDLRKVGVI
jgi:RNA polymerase sigma-70 factor (ECF subfamily)